jgi:hypothetical protein
MDLEEVICEMGWGLAVNCEARPKSRSVGVGARRPLPANGWANVFSGTTRIGAHCYATVLVTKVHCFTVES